MTSPWPAQHRPRSRRRTAGRRPPIPETPFQPLYQQIKGCSRSAWNPGEWRRARSDPSEQDLAAVQRESGARCAGPSTSAAGRNIVVRRQGKGTFVATHTETKSSMFRFRACAAMTVRTSIRQRTVRRAAQRPATAEIARADRHQAGRRRAASCAGCYATAASRTVLDEITLPAAFCSG